ncbi:hypothetical protein EJ08DRAFT_660522 [Tothia fuscella]|uniref:Uncharacterized protein n=1 Tax=Tothia fuscella TaxID=1048955 RepID=A0A9P4NSE3_9PEZI|nr:hypothetical protein EJ08DRAFT_660522 [Tothia fuscella]
METIERSSKSFQVIRISKQPENALDPCPDFDFIPPRDSDELYNALRTAFPKGSTHRERMMEAVIAFGASETDVSGEVTGLKIPPSMGLPTALKGNRPTSAPVMHQTTSECSADHHPDKRPWQHMTSSWSSATEACKARPKAPMTTRQRTEYRKRREIGACGECKRKKKKCTHVPSQSNGHNHSDKAKESHIIKQSVTANSSQLVTKFSQTFSIVYRADEHTQRA